MTVFATQEFNVAVARFKSLFGTHHELYEWGQFYVTDALQSEILRTIELELRNSLGFQITLGLLGEAGVKARLEDYMPYFRMELAKPPEKIPVGFILSDIIPGMEKKENTTFPAMRNVFTAGSPTKADAKEVQQIFEQLWNRRELPTARPYLSNPTIGKLFAARRWERNKCFTVAKHMARMVLAKQKITSLDPKLRISLGTIPGVVVKEGQFGPGHRERQQIIVYGNQAILKDKVRQMQTMLSPTAKGMVQFGVLSGVRQGKKIFQQPEHYLLAFASGKVNGQEAFLCWDPDASHSNMEPAWGPGFACLLHASGRLSTALDDQDLKAIEMDAKLKEEEYGDHLANRRRHCYQVYYVQTLPQ